MPEPDFERGVFLNCPFDAAYRPLFEAIIFAIHDCGYVARCSLEVTDASQVRIDKISGIIASCSKNCLILDVDRYRYQRFVSDIAGQDISAHGGSPDEAIKAVRNWLSAAAPSSVKVPGGATMVRRYLSFRSLLPEACGDQQMNVEDLTFNEYVLLVEEWLKLNAGTYA